MVNLCTDAGHGGTDSGAAWGGVLEKDMNREYTLQLNEELKRRGYRVLTTRKADFSVPPLRTRCQLVNEHHRQESPGFDAVVSIHCNVAAAEDQATGQLRVYPNRRGFYAIYSEESSKSTALASAIANACKDAGIVLSHGGMLSTVKLGRTLAWIHRTTPPSTLLELGYMTNPEDLELLQQESYRSTLITAIADGIAKYLRI
ncbi:MAG: N-acetylmuramoyl-L-alanine amidase [bacterium]|nr:N-acetylmuramoyl-L-alanine amidase [bacterium]